MTPSHRGAVRGGMARIAVGLGCAASVVAASTAAASAPSVIAGAGVAPASPRLAHAWLVIYLNREGGTYHPSPNHNDARTNTSTIPSAETTIGVWDVDDATWGRLVACVSAAFGAYAVEIVDQDPGDAPHVEVAFPANGGLPGVTGRAAVSPFASDCSVIENSISYVFPGRFQLSETTYDEPALCEVIAHELGHGLGLDHHYHAADLMSYLDHEGARSFVDLDMPCGEAEVRACGQNGVACGATQNSHQLLLERIGSSDPDSPYYPRAEASGCRVSTTRPATPGNGWGSGAIEYAPTGLIALLGLLRPRRRAAAAIGSR